MATQTTNLGLALPIGSEKVSRQIINQNNQLIDDFAGQTTSNFTTVNTAITNINSKVNSLISISNRVSGTASLPSGEWVTLAEFNPSAEGTYIIVSDCGYEQHTNGIRILLVDSVETPANTEVNSVLATGRASLQKTRMFALTTTNIIYIRAYQNSGSTITASYNYQYIRFN